MENDLNERLLFLEESRYSHFSIAKNLPYRNKPLGVFAFVVLKRSLSLVYGFCSLIRAKNFVSAAPLVRLQIDNLLRFHAVFLASDSNQFIVDVLSGKEVRHLKDRHGKRMTDAYLQETLAGDYPWLIDVYKKTSGYIHLSDQHLFNTIQSVDDEGGIRAYIGPDDKFVSVEVYEESVETMILVTYELLKYLALRFGLQIPDQQAPD